MRYDVSHDDRLGTKREVGESPLRYWHRVRDGVSARREANVTG
ncbi:hypothetical protein ACIBG5_35465 [Kribbella sp. NPDC050241]